jgi:histone H3/H4
MKLNDNKRIQLLWEEILAQNPSKHPQVSLQDQSKQLLLEYTEELTQSLIEAASAIAESKGSRQIDESDIALLLGMSFLLHISRGI